jgi:L-ascorbate metabolism protein UlaG (beta-lactamase superfamily)
MDVQFHGANCITLSYKGTRIVVDDNLASLGGKSVTKADDVALFTGAHGVSAARLTLDSPGEYEVADISIVGIAAQAHIDERGTKRATMFKLIVGDTSLLITGHIYPELSDAQQEAIGIIDAAVIPVGGSGYTVDPVGALKIIKEVEPKVVIPTHYDDKALKFEVPQVELEFALKELGMEPQETTAKLKLKHTDLSDVTQLVVLEKS